MAKIDEKKDHLKNLNAYSSEMWKILDRQEISDEVGEKISLDEGNKMIFSLLSGVKKKKGKVILVGNGGSAAIVAHMQNDLCKCDGIRAMVLTDTPLLTALVNDNGYSEAYAKQVDMWAEERDLLIAVSSSGMSNNIIQAVRVAVHKKMKVLTLSGFSKENILRQIGDLNIYIPSNSYGLVELTHSVICHYITDCMASYSDDYTY